MIMNWSEFLRGPDQGQEQVEAPAVPPMPTSLPEKPGETGTQNDPQKLQETMHEVIPIPPVIEEVKEDSQEREKYLDATEYFIERVKDFSDRVADAQEQAHLILESDNSPAAQNFLKGAGDLIESLAQQAKVLTEDYNDQVITYAENNPDTLPEAEVIKIKAQFEEALLAADSLQYDLHVITELKKKSPEVQELYWEFKELENQATTFDGFLLAIASFVKQNKDAQPGSPATPNMPPDFLPDETAAFAKKIDIDDDEAQTKSVPVVEPPLPDGSTQPRPVVDVKTIGLGETVPVKVNVIEQTPSKRPDWQQEVARYLPPKLQEKLDRVIGPQARPEQTGQPDMRQWLSDQFAAMREMNVAGRGFDLRGMTNYVGQMVERMSAAQPADKLKVAEDYWNHLSGPERSMMLAVLAVVGRQDATPMKMDASLQGQYQNDPEARRVAQLLTEKLSNVASLGQAFATEYLPVLKDLFVRAQMLLEEPRTGTAQLVGGTAESRPVAKTPSGPVDVNQQQQVPKAPEAQSVENNDIEALKKQNILEIKTILKAIDQSSLSPADIKQANLLAAKNQLSRVVGVVTMGVSDAEKYSRFVNTLKEIGIENVLKAALAQEQFDPSAMEPVVKQTLEVLRT